MDHEQAVRQKATERYLLDELDPEIRDQFEEHLFDCQDCALDVRAAAMFVEQSKGILGEPAIQPAVKVPARAATKPGWFAWLRPAFAVPMLALLLAVVGYQNFVTYPKLMQAANEPQVGPWASVNVSTRGSETTTLKAHPGEGFGLLVNFPPQEGFASYVIDLYNPAGKLEWSGPISAEAGQDRQNEDRQIYIPGRNRLPGTYTLVVHGINAAGVSKELSRHPIDLQIQ
jgi:Putative zinc-finger